MALSIGELVGYVTLNTTGVKAGAAQVAGTMGALGKGMDRAGIEAGNGWVRGADGKLRNAQGRFVSAGEQAAAGLGQGVQKKSGMLSSAWAKAVGVMAIGAAVKGAVNLEATYSKTMAQIAASTGAPKAEMTKMDALAMKLGKDTSFSASDAAGAMLELAKAGISTSDIMGGALKGTLTLAAAGSTDLGTASTIASNAMNTFGLKGKDMAQIAAALAGGANASSASVESLGQALAQVGPGATNAGLSLQDTVGVLAAFDSAGIKGSDAGTSLKTMLTNLVPATSSAARAMEQYGLYSYDAKAAVSALAEKGLKPASSSFEDVHAAVAKYAVASGLATAGSGNLNKVTEKLMMSMGATHSAFVNTDGSFKNVADIAGILQNKLGGLSQAQRTAAMSTIFGSDASRAATVLMKDGKAGIEKYVKAAKDKNAAEAMAKANMSGTAGALERMKGSIETAGLSLGTLLAPAVVHITGLIGGFANGLSGLTNAMDHHHGAALTVVAVLGTLTAVTLAHNAAMAVSAAGGMAQWLTQTKLISMASKVWAAVQWALNAAMSANPIMLVVIAIAALVGAAILAYNKVSWFHDGVQAAFNGVVNAAGAVVGFIKQHWPVLLAILTGPIGVAVLVIAKHWDSIKAGASNVVDWIKGIPGKIGALGGKFGQAGKDLLQGFIDGMKNAAGVIAGIAGNVWDAVKGLLNGAIRKINAALEFKISLPGKDLSINPPDIPQLATGGRATAATLAVIGEGREPESVLPDSVLRGLLERAHAAGAASGQGAGGRNAPLIGSATFTEADPNVVAEHLWFLTRTRG